MKERKEEEKKEKRRKKIIGTYTRIPYELCPDSIDGNSRGQRHGGVSIDQAEIQDIYVHNDAPYCKFVTLYHR